MVNNSSGTSPEPIANGAIDIVLESHKRTPLQEEFWQFLTENGVGDIGNFLAQHQDQPDLVTQLYPVMQEYLQLPEVVEKIRAKEEQQKKIMQQQELRAQEIDREVEELNKLLNSLYADECRKEELNTVVANILGTDRKIFKLKNEARRLRLFPEEQTSTHPKNTPNPTEVTELGVDPKSNPYSQKSPD